MSAASPLMRARKGRQERKVRFRHKKLAPAHKAASDHAPRIEDHAQSPPHTPGRPRGPAAGAICCATDFRMPRGGPGWQMVATTGEAVSRRTGWHGFRPSPTQGVRSVPGRSRTAARRSGAPSPAENGHQTGGLHRADLTQPVPDRVDPGAATKAIKSRHIARLRFLVQDDAPCRSDPGGGQHPAKARHARAAMSRPMHRHTMGFRTTCGPSGDGMAASWRSKGPRTHGSVRGLLRVNRGAPIARCWHPRPRRH